MRITPPGRARELMPLCTAFIDEVREVFGAPVGIRATEGDYSLEWGTLSSARARWVVPILEDHKPAKRGRG